LTESTAADRLSEAIGGGDSPAPRPAVDFLENVERPGVSE